MNRVRVFLAGTVLSISTAALCNNTRPYSQLPRCKAAPSDLSWPPSLEWQNLNASIGGLLLRTAPAASSCYVDNPFGAPDSCDDVSYGWGYSYFHSNVPESIDYLIWANNSCLPPNATGYEASLGCRVGGYPSYIVNATTSAQVATALKWASDRSIRVVVKGTGHDLSGRSTGAFSLSIWTLHFNYLEIDNSWQILGSSDTGQVLITGSGNNWGKAVLYSLGHNRVVTSGVDRTVGLGGFIQGSGHGPLSSTYGLAADQLLQARVATVAGGLLTCNLAQNQYLFWALRGGGGGQYGVVTEYVLLTYPMPATLTSASISLAAANMSGFPNVMDQGITGSGAAFTGVSASGILGIPGPVPGVLVSLNVWALNITSEAMRTLFRPLQSNIISNLSDASLISFKISGPSTSTNYADFFEAINASPSTAGQISLTASRLLGHAQLSDLVIDENHRGGGGSFSSNI